MRDLSGETTPGGGDASAYGVVVRRSEQGWQVGDEQAADLTSAMVLADLLAADLGSPVPTQGPPAGISGLSGISGPRRSTPVAESVVDSASNPLLPLPEELARKQAPARKRGRSPRHANVGGRR